MTYLTRPHNNGLCQFYMNMRVILIHNFDNLFLSESLLSIYVILCMLWAFKREKSCTTGVQTETRKQGMKLSLFLSMCGVR